MRRPALRWVLAAVALAWALIVTVAVLNRPAPTPVRAVTPSVTPSPKPLTVAEVYKTLIPSVVQIRSSGGSLKGPEIGAGTIVRDNGSILTASHVVRGAGRIQVTYADGTTSDAKVADSDAARDIATLTVAKLPETVVPATLGGGVGVGDEVTAIGSPLGLTASTTSGVVSGLNRPLAEAGAGAGSRPISGLIQFDAAVNPGSSGGPLLNDRAQVVGVVVALANPTDAGTFIGIGFAVPIGQAAGSGIDPPL